MSRKKKQLMTLHDSINPNQEVEIDTDDFSAAVPAGDVGSLVKLKSGDQIHVHESSIEVKRIYLNLLDD